MASVSEWIEGARPPAWPNAIAPVLVGTGAAASLDAAVWWKAALALLVSISLIVGVNFANDYSDGIRGTDDVRVGPIRLVGSKLASPRSVKRAAFACFGVAAVAGVALALASVWWLTLIGAVCILGAWYYTGGRNPYGYRGFGEVAVFVFVGFVAVCGTQFVQANLVNGIGLVAAVAVGSFSSAVLVANNLRDIPTDAESGKCTLAVRLGVLRTRILYLVLLSVPFVVTVALVVYTPWALAGFLAAPLAVKASAPVRSGAQGLALIPALAGTGAAMFIWSGVIGAALWLG